MSNKSSGYLVSIFGCCKRTKRNAVSIESRESYHNYRTVVAQNAHTQTNENAKSHRSFNKDNNLISTPSSFKPVIVVKKGPNFEPQSPATADTKTNIQKSASLGLSLPSAFQNDSIDTIPLENSEEGLMSSRTFQQIFKESNSNISWSKSFSKLNPLPSPFVCESNFLRPKLKPVTPESFSKKIPGSTRNIKRRELTDYSK
ncbi:unnamed protein product [Blepharisma stoltei]|uniref:Uncharacterized protein n=1 Tax=Blepharisma stoltei TaxID=1481888 RepID=A0AAU9JXT1_9CILI|nr:unnamed protein product [Blepharisma stoltei]